MNSNSVFYYVHDPMCSWCWGHRPIWELMRPQLEMMVPIQYRVGGLAEDSDVPMPDEKRAFVMAHWQRVTEVTGVEFNYDFWQNNVPRRSTYPACRATLAARWQNREQEMIDALQLAYYQRALNPSDQSVHQQLAQELNLDVERFVQDLNSPILEREFQDEVRFSRSLPINGFPSMVLFHHDRYTPITLSYTDASASLNDVKALLGLNK